MFAWIDFTKAQTEYYTGAIPAEEFYREQAEAHERCAAILQPTHPKAAARQIELAAEYVSRADQLRVAIALIQWAHFSFKRK